MSGKNRSGSQVRTVAGEYLLLARVRYKIGSIASEFSNRITGILDRRRRPRSVSRHTASTDVASDSEASTGCPSVADRGNNYVRISIMPMRYYVGGFWHHTMRRHRLDVVLDLDRTMVNSFEIRKAGRSESENVTPILQEIYRDE